MPLARHRKIAEIYTFLWRPMAFTDGHILSIVTSVSMVTRFNPRMMSGATERGQKEKRCCALQNVAWNASSIGRANSIPRSHTPLGSAASHPGGAFARTNPTRLLPCAAGEGRRVRKSERSRACEGMQKRGMKTIARESRPRRLKRAVVKALGRFRRRRS